MAARPAIVWFRRDLRLRHHPALMAAATDGREVVPVFVLDPAFADAGAPRGAFLHDSLQALDGAIRGRGGSGLVLRSGRPVEVIGALADELDAGDVYVSRDFAPYGRRRDAAVAEALRARGRALRGVGSPYAVDPGTVTKRDGTPYAVFTPFAKAWRERSWSAPIDPGRVDDVTWTRWTVGADPLGPRPDPRCDLPPAGEEAALDRWREFLADGLAGYAQQRNDPSIDGTSRLSAALKWGAIHPCQLLADLDGTGSRGSAHATFTNELAWREFYADVLFRQPWTAWENLNRRMDALPVDSGADAVARFDRWCAGTTGFGIVDAGMHQLAATGWMHNRVRMITASFLVKDLHLPWQWGARWFMQHLVDGDLASNNHGWQWVAGTGTDAAPYFRVFNPVTQEQRFDASGEYVRRWAPEAVEPMLDHATERAEALRRHALVPR